MAKKSLLLVVLLYSIVHFGYSVWTYNPVVYENASGDFQAIYQCVKEWRQTGEYRLAGWESGYVYHPSFYYLLYLPFTLLDFKVVTYLFYFSQFLWLPFALVWMVQAASPERKVSLKEFLLAGILTVNFLSFLETFSQHKVEGIELALICLAVLLFRKKRDFWAGVILALATNLKYLPFVLLAYFLLKREWRVIAGAAAAQGVISLAVIGALGWSTFWVYTVAYPWRVLTDPTTPYAWKTALLEWQSLGGTINRWFAAPIKPEKFLYHYLVGGIGPIVHAGWAYGIANTLKAGFLLLWLWIIRRRWAPAQREEKWNLYLLEISISLIMIVVLCTIARVQYGILLLPAFVYVALLLFRDPERFRWSQKALLLGGYLLSAMGVPGGLLKMLPAHPVWGQEHALMYRWLSLPFYGYMLLGACILLSYLRLIRNLTPKRLQHRILSR